MSVAELFLLAAAPCGQEVVRRQILTNSIMWENISTAEECLSKPLSIPLAQELSLAQSEHPGLPALRPGAMRLLRKSARAPGKFSQWIT